MIVDMLAVVSSVWQWYGDVLRKLEVVMRE